MTQKLIYVHHRATSDSSPDAILIGEAPGAEEEKQGEPFVGKSGKLLRKTIEETLKIDDYFMTNVIKVRPEKNRTPTDKEIESWLPLLRLELEVLEQIVDGIPIIAVGKVAERACKYLKIPYTYIYHPSYILRNPSKKEEWINQIKEAYCAYYCVA